MSCVRHFPRLLFSVLIAVVHLPWVIFFVLYILGSLYILDSIPLSLPFYKLPLCLTDSFLCFTKVFLFHKVSEGTPYSFSGSFKVFNLMLRFLTYLEIYIYIYVERQYSGYILVYAGI